jgi:prefoldin subunit 5
MSSTSAKKTFAATSFLCDSYFYLLSSSANLSERIKQLQKSMNAPAGSKQQRQQESNGRQMQAIQPSLIPGFLISAFAT